MTQILCVDLDGTLIRTDTVQEATLAFMQAHPFQAWRLLVWLCRGRAYLKQQLGRHVVLEPSLLPYHAVFLSWLKQRKQSGVQLVLVTATDQVFANAVAAHLGLFDDVLASDGKINLRAQYKAAALNARFGIKGYDYAGNSRDDLRVWCDAQHAIMVNAPAQVVRAAKACSAVAEIFE